jgi:tetratricopeptide (TPR) repeat protein
LDQKESELKKDTAASGERSEWSRSRSDAKTEELYQQGEELFDKGLFQRAIHIWTRILFLDRGNVGARKAIDRAKRSLAERQRRLDAEVAEGTRLLEAGDTEAARCRIRSVLAIDPRHVEALQVAEGIASRDRRQEEGRASQTNAVLEVAPASPKRGLLVRVSKTAPVRTETAASPLKMAVFVLASVLVFAAGALYLHLNWDSFVSDGAFENSVSAMELSEPEPSSVPGPAELRYYNGARLFAKGRYREALAELSLVDRSSPSAERARSLILRIEERLLRGGSEEFNSATGDTN